MRSLAGAGRPDLALSLYAEALPSLREPARSEAFLEAGMILWRQMEYEKAARAFRQVSETSGAAPRAASYLARYLAATGDAQGAARALSGIPEGEGRNLVAGEIETTRVGRGRAAAAWPSATPGSAVYFSRAIALSRAGAVAAETGELRAAADNASTDGHSERAAALEALAFACLAQKDFEGALSAARDALSAAARWKAAAERRSSRDGAGEGSVRSWRSLAALFPYDEGTGKFLSTGGRFLSASALHEAHRGAEAVNGELSRRVAAAKEGLSLRRKNVDGSIRRAEEILKTARDNRRKAEGMRERLRGAARFLPLSAWGAMTDPRRAALIEEVEAKSRKLRDRLASAGAALDAAADKGKANPLPPEDRKMIFHAQRRIARMEDGLYALEGRAAFRKISIRNTWKAAYVARLSLQMEQAESAAKTFSGVASRAKKTILRLREAQAETAAWETALDRFRKRLADGSSTLSKRRAETKSAADRELSGAGRELLAAIGRSERQVRYLAARAATEWRIEDQAQTAGAALLSSTRRQDLFTEAVRHWEAILPSPGVIGVASDEALYALAELRFEEAESRYLQKEDPSGRNPDFSVPVTLFRKVIEEYPASPYSEQALYGLALSFQEAGAVDNAVAAMNTLLARHPGTRYADELHLRLGEYAFDESDYPKAEEQYRMVSAGAPPEIRVTALFKSGWSLFLLGRPGEAVEPFLSALLLSPAARKTGGVPKEALAMAARSLVEANREADAEAILTKRDGSAQGPALLLHIQDLLATQNRYAEAAAVADRMGKSYPMAAERVDAELAAAEALRKGGKEEESHSRKANFRRVFGPGSAWRAYRGRAPREAERAGAVSEEALRGAAFFFHARSRQSPPGDRRAVLALYDDFLAFFPSSAKAEEVAYQRAWLLFEDGRTRDAAPAFEEVALRPGGTRGEASRYMAVQCAKDVSSPADAASQAEVVRLCREYERFFPRGERIFLALMDSARAHANLRQFAPAAEAAGRAAGLAGTSAELRAALRLEGDARFEREEFSEAETSFRAILKTVPPPEEEREAAKWIGFSLFRRAEKLPKERAAEAAELFAGVVREFPFLEIAPVARFRAGTAYAAAGKTPEAIATLLPVESARGESALSLDATRWLARLYETSGNALAAGERYERLASDGGPSPEEKTKNLLRAADLFFLGKEMPRARKTLVAVASLPGAPPDLRVRCLFRAGESARAEGNLQEADRHYEAAVAAHGSAPEAAPAVAGMALFHLAEYRYRGYRELAITPPLAKTFPVKLSALEESAKLYLEAIRWGDATTVSAGLHRIGEAFEDFRSSILSSPPPRGLSEREREEYSFLLEEKAAPIEEKALEAYLKNLRQAVAADFRSEWVEKSLQRLKALRPTRFGKKGEYAFPVLTVPVFRGMIERSVP